ncbi:MAG: hypothetical protein V3V08_04540 [Nannocystaceae bacterium]
MASVLSQLVRPYTKSLTLPTVPSSLSLLRQGLRWYDLSLTMNQDRCLALMRRFDQLIHRQVFSRELLGAT